jgi:hypothetical protein
MNTENMGNFGTDYLKRASVELAGLGANLQEDAIYPLAFVDDAGHPLTGKNRYVLHFDKKDLPRRRSTGAGSRPDFTRPARGRPPRSPLPERVRSASEPPGQAPGRL